MKRFLAVPARELMLVIIFSLIATLFGPLPAQAAPAGYSEYFIPGSTDQLFRILQDIDNNPQLGNAFGVGTCATGIVPGGGVGGCNYMRNVITVSVTTNGTTIYYDHWENGYSAANAGDEVYIANNGDVLVFESANIQVPRAAGNTCLSTNRNGASTACYDGRDRLYVAGGAVAVAQAFWPEVTATVYANAWEVYPVKPYQTSYTIPVGEDLFTNFGYADFRNVYVIVLAARDGTNLQINDPLTPGVDVTVTLNQGQVAELLHINSGTVITASNPVQVQFMVGQFNTGIASDSRSYTAVPDGLWSTSYYSPVPGGGTASDTDIYVYNPTASPLSINYQDSAGTGTFVVPAGATRSYSDLVGRYVPFNSAVYLALANGTTRFWAIGSYDTENADYNYGFTLVPANLLTNDYYVGWAPGSTNLSANGSPVFVTPVQDNTTIFVDYGPADGVVDATFFVNRLQVLKLRDPDNNNTGMHVWGTGPFAITWGEDSQFAAVGNPFIDAGYTILPLDPSWMDVVLSLEKTVTPPVIPAEIGQVVTFRLVVESSQPLNPANVFDDMPSGWAYVPLSTVITRPGGVVVSGPSVEPVITGQRLTWNDVSPGGLVPGQPLTIEFQSVTTAIPTAGYIINNASVSGFLGTEVFTATDSAAVQVSELLLEKTSNAGGVVLPGQTISYTLTVTNSGEAPQTNLAISDPLPAGTTFVPGSTQVIAPSLNGTVGDSFATIAFDGNQDSNGAAVPNWLGDWNEVGEADGAAAGNLQVLADLGDTRLRIQGANHGVFREADLLGCTSAYLRLTYRRAALNAATDFVRLGIGTGGSVTDTLFDFAGPTVDAAYQTYTVNITNWIDVQTRIRLLASPTLGAAENIFFDDARIDCYNSTVSPGGAPPNLVTAADGYSLLSGQQMTISYQVVLNDPVPPGQTEVVNVAQATSDQQVEPLQDSTTDRIGGLLDPPFGLKVFDDSGLPLLQWTVAWINDANTVPVSAFSSDPIPEGTTFSSSGAPSGFPVPVGAPAGSTNLGVSCQPDPASSTTSTSLCYYEGPTTTYPRGRIIWQGILGPDFGLRDVTAAQNEIAITFRVVVADSVTRVFNRATIDIDQNNDSDFDDPGEQEVADSSSEWQRSSDPDNPPRPTPAPSPSSFSALLIPVTGFSPGRETKLPIQPERLAYSAQSDLTLNIPLLNVKLPIVGVPFVDGGWDVTWLGNAAGYLQGTAFPTWKGNSLITAHVYDSNGQPGPFASLATLKWGDKIQVEAYGQVYTYEVRSVYTVRPWDQRPFAHKKEAWLTLITCKEYDIRADTYRLRTIVQAVLVSVSDPK